MNQDRELRIQRKTALLVAALLLCFGGITTYFVLQSLERNRGTRPGSAASHAPAPATSEHAAAPHGARSDDPMQDVRITLTEDAIARAGIKTTVVTTGQGNPTVRLPGVVEPNAYKQVTVTPLVSGRVTHVSAELGQHVKRGQLLAQVYSPELAEAHTNYISARAMLDAHDRELRRTEKLADIGAASRQEVERAHAEHAAQVAAVEAARSRLQLLGVTAAALDTFSPEKSGAATAMINAPLDGVVTERFANVGLNVEPSTKLFTVVDLATVWIVADVYEKDLSRVAVGAAATISTAAFSDHPLEGRVSYIDPQVSAATRTAKVRVEVANPRGELRLGMYATALVRTGATAAIMVPARAVQRIGDRQVVYLKATEADTFIEREVHTAPAGEDRIIVLSGLHAGDTVVTEGSFFVRAERERLTPRD